MAVVQCVVEGRDAGTVLPDSALQKSLLSSTSCGGHCGHFSQPCAILRSVLVQLALVQRSQQVQPHFPSFFSLLNYLLPALAIKDIEICSLV